MKITSIFTDEELALIDSGKYTPGRAVLDAKLDLAMALEREACAKLCDAEEETANEETWYQCAKELAKQIRARGQA
jgi:tRNA U34 5-carboxymethylaminomethyl modifying GTPase MnmE/TrmE